MKKIVFAFVVVGSIVACAPKLVTPVPMPEEITEAPEPEPAINDIASAGKLIFNSDCTKCHSLKVIDNHTKQQWTGILTKMTKMAKLDETQTNQVTQYVFWELEQ
ncbi:MAG: cytochrome c5 [Crocinitomicaceae bacterium]|jgi:cytochrome c5